MDGNFTFWPSALIAFAVSFLASLLVVHYKGLLSIHATSDKRRHHTRRIPQLGGVGIVLGLFLASLPLLRLMPAFDVSIQLLPLAGAFALCLVFGLADDKFELQARWKFLGQVAVTGALWYSLRDYETPMDRAFGQGSLVSTAFECFWCLGALNSINFIDGMDGLASGIGMLVISFLCFTNDGEPLVTAALTWIAIPAILGFFLWNRSSARIFLGEAGSQAIGVLIFLAVVTYKGAQLNSGNIIAPFFAMGIPIFDTLMAILRRRSRGVGIMSADREHIHHRLLRLGLSHANVVRFLHALTAYLCLIGYQFTVQSQFRYTTFALVMSGLGINLFLLMIAEKKLYSYLTGFASHMLKLVDSNKQDSLNYHRSLETYENSGAPYFVFQLNLEKAVSSLLEQNPGKIQPFYELLSDSLRAGSRDREVHFATSTRAFVLEPLKPGASAEGMEQTLLRELERIEREHKLDLYLNLRETLKRAYPPISGASGTQKAA